MSSDWVETVFSDICVITRGASPRPIHDWMTEGDGIPWVKISDATASNSRFIGKTSGKIKKDGASRSVEVFQGDLILSNSATPGIPRFMGINACIHDGWLLLRDFRGATKEYLYYLLEADRPKLVAQGNGSVFTNLKTDILKNHRVHLPPLQEQKAIAHILGTLDDKIELNRKTNETLEAMAKALFKSWFVDFDPVRAKAEGRSTGLPAEISDLFPESFEDSELGEIPTGWRVGTIASSVGEVFDGPHATPKEADEGNVFLGIKNMTGSSLDLSDVKLIGHDDWSQWTRRVEPKADDIVFTYEAALGLFAVIPHGLKCCLGRRMALIRTKATNGTPHFWFHQFIAKPFQKVIEERSIHGATVNRTPLTEFPGYPILEPPDTLRLAFDHAASSLWARIHAASNQTASLTALRDTLLPKLISGELRIPDTQKMLEEVGI